MKKLIVIFAAAVMMTSLAAAQTTAPGTLNVTANVTGTIQVVFFSHTGGVALASGEGQSTAALNFGTVSAFGTIPGTITRTTTATNFTISTPVDVEVDQSNTTSASYNLTAQLGTADGNTWALTGTTLSTTPVPIVSGGTYGSKVAMTVAITIPFAAPAGTVSNAINFLATAQ